MIVIEVKLLGELQESTTLTILALQISAGWNIYEIETREDRSQLESIPAVQWV